MSPSKDELLEYLRDVGLSGLPDVDDAFVIRCLGTFVAEGFVTELDWETEFGMAVIQAIHDNWDSYTSWKSNLEG